MCTWDTNSGCSLRSSLKHGRPHGRPPSLLPRTHQRRIHNVHFDERSDLEKVAWDFFVKHNDGNAGVDQVHSLVEAMRKLLSEEKKGLKDGDTVMLMAAPPGRPNVQDMSAPQSPLCSCARVISLITGSAKECASMLWWMLINCIPCVVGPPTTNRNDY